MDDTSDPREAALAELAAYFGVSRDEALRRCVDWERESLTEWQAGDRSSADGLADFYRTQVSWIYDTMWYHANQYHGAAFPESVVVAQQLGIEQPGRHLDFGAGPGTSSLLFHALGWQVALADLSSTFLRFARWRLERHHVPAQYYDLLTDELPDAAFDLVSAFDVMVHVKDIPATLRRIHRAMKLGGRFVFNIDIRERSPETAFHLYEGDYQILRHMHAAGFRRDRNISFFYVFQKVEHGALRAAIGWLESRLRYNRLLWRASWLKWRLRRRFFA